MVDFTIKVTVPKEVMNSSQMRGQITQTLRNKTAPDLQRMFKGTVNGWADKPSFLQKFRDSQSYMSATVYVSPNNSGGETYMLVNAGSRPHTIRPRRARMLRFQPGYRAATRPRVLSSRSFSRSGNFISAQQVNHPGFEAREFDDTIAEEYAPTFAADMQDAIRVATVRTP